MNIKQLQEKARKEFEKDVMSYKEFREMTMGCFYQDELREAFDRVFLFVDTLIEQTYKEAQKQERQRIIEEIKNKKRIPVKIDKDYDGPDTSELLTAGYNEALKDIILKIKKYDKRDTIR